MTTATVTDTETRTLYGPTGWTVEAGVWDILAECRDTMRADTIPTSFGLEPRAQIINGYPVEDYTPFHDLGPDQAARLLSALPERTLTERQNVGPSLGSCLRACVAGGGSIRLSGYGVGPQRPDERLSVEGMWIADPDLLAMPINPMCAWGCQCRQVWETVRDRYHLDTGEDPDEIRHALRWWSRGPEGVWMWWD